MAVNAATISRRTAGRVGCGGGPGSVDLVTPFSPEPLLLQEGDYVRVAGNNLELVNR